MTGIRRIVIATVVLAAASAVLGVIMLASRPTSSAMSGMDMSGSPTSAPTMAPDMPGMDMSGSNPTPTPTPTPTMAPDMPGMDMSGTSHGEHGATTEDVADRPLAPVLGTFGAGSAAVLLTAGILRRKDRATNLAKKTARAAGKAKK